MQFREHPGVMGKRDAYPFDPKLLKIDDDYNVRDLDAADERDDLDELKESIRANGVRVPLEVRLVDEDVFIVAGHRRHKAVMELIKEGEEIKSVPVMPEPKYTNEADRILNLIVSNSGKPLKPLEIAEVVRRLVAFGWDEAQIAKRVGWKSKASVKQHLDMLAMPEPVKAQVKAGDISATEAAKVVKNLAKGTDPAEAAKMIAANKEENKKLGVGAKTGHKVTAKTLKRDQPKSDPKPAPFVAEDESAAAQGKTTSIEIPEHTGPRLSEGEFLTRMQEIQPTSSRLPAPPNQTDAWNAGIAARAPSADAPTPEVHEQLQNAADRERPQPPSRAYAIRADIMAALGKVCVLAEDNSIGERSDDEVVEISVALLKECWRAYKAATGDV